MQVSAQPRVLDEMRDAYVDPSDGAALTAAEQTLKARGTVFPIVDGVPRFVTEAGITENWSRQWRVWSRLHYSEHFRQKTYEGFKVKFGFDPHDRECPSLRVLDAGCGNGRNAALFAGSQHRVWAVDSSQSVDFARKNVPASNVEFLQADIANLPFPGGFFDLVISDGVLIHVPDIRACIEHLASKVRPGGTLSIACAKKIDSSQRFALAHEAVINAYRRFTVGLKEPHVTRIVDFLSSLYRYRTLPFVGRLTLLLVPEWSDDEEWRKCYIHDYLTAVIRERQSEANVLSLFREAGLVDIVSRESHEIRLSGRKV